MSFWSEIVGRIRGVFGRRGRPLPPLPPPIKQIVPKQYVSMVWGHLLYNPIKSVTGFIVPKCRSLDEFVKFAEIQGIEQVKTTHPLALEVVCSILLDYEITTKSPAFAKIKQALEESITEIYPNFAPEILPHLQWGVEVAEVKEKPDEELYAEKRFSRDGETFQEFDISNFVEAKLRSLIQ